MQRNGEPVVVGVDGSAGSVAALRWAVGLAMVEHRPLRVLHATGVHGDDRERDFGGRLVVQEAVRTARGLEPAVRVQGDVRPGRPQRVLADASERAAVVAVGARGRGALVRAVGAFVGPGVGSVGSELAREAWCPVVVVRTDVGSSAAPVVLGLDCTPTSAAATDFAFRMAASRGVPLTVLHSSWDTRERAAAVLDTRGYAAQADRAEQAEQEVATALQEAAARYPEVPVTVQHRCGEPAHELLEASRHTSLVVVGCHRWRSRLHRSVSRRVAEHADAPVAVVHA